MKLELSLAAAERAIDASDLGLALVIWRNIRLEYPLDPTSYTRAASCLIKAGRVNEAEELVSTAPLHLLGDLDFARQWASVAQHGHNFEATVARWQILQVLFPDDPAGYTGLAASLRDNRQIQAADQILKIAMRQFPDRASPLIEYAHLAAAQGNSDEAIQRWTIVRNRFPEEVSGYAGGADTLTVSGQFEAADIILQDAIDRFPGNVDLHILYAQSAETRGYWTLAAARWASALLNKPDDGWLLHRFNSAKRHVRRPTDTPDMFKLMMLFESLGSAKFGSEFGMAQGMFGAEPASLLRWSDIAIDRLTEALAERFIGVGELQNTEVAPSFSGEGAEYVTIDRTFRITTRTFIAATEDMPAGYLEIACRRMQFLRQKLLSDLAGANRIYVFKIAEAVDERQIRQLHLELSKYSENALLCVRLADTTYPAGTFELLAPNLLVGYVERFTGSQTAELDEGLTMSWGEICRRACKALGRY